MRMRIRSSVPAGVFRTGSYGGGNSYSGGRLPTIGSSSSNGGEDHQKAALDSDPTLLSSSSATAGRTTRTSSMDDADIAAGQMLLLQQQEQEARADHMLTKAKSSAPSSTGTTASLSSASGAANQLSQQELQHQHRLQVLQQQPLNAFNNHNGAVSSSSRKGVMTPPSSIGSSINLPQNMHPADLEFFEDLVSEPVLVLGVDISHLSRRSQFLVCAAGVFCFSLLYGYLQELISVTLCSRKLGLFLAMVQFSGYTLLAYVMRSFVYTRQQGIEKRKQQKEKEKLLLLYGNADMNGFVNDGNAEGDQTAANGSAGVGKTVAHVPLAMYLGLSLLRAVDLAMTNMAMQYINYPAKTLMKSSRVVFTMIFGVVVSRKVYKPVDYLIVIAMVVGLALFMHADANSSAVFHHWGVVMLTVSLTCDGAISNMSETIMSKFGVGQDEFIFRMYSIALVAITAAAAVKGDLKDGLIWMSQPGTYDEVLQRQRLLEETGDVPVTDPASDSDAPVWSVCGKIAVIALFSSMGFFGSSCSAAITKNFGALTMSITSTARKATTLFLSFFLFNNVCTLEHLFGVFVFITALTTKSLRRGRKSGGKGGGRGRHHHRRHRNPRKVTPMNGDAPDGDVELCGIIADEDIPRVVVPTGSDDSESGSGGSSPGVHQRRSRQHRDHSVASTVSMSSVSTNDRNDRNSTSRLRKTSKSPARPKYSDAQVV